ncbi:hypothetical protein HUN03_00350 [Mycoplasmopsis anatis]|uniref:hypothetical protein n=1 Tax=Mycoplasmopsis anatis TaxID=171279 RepID=UPI001C4E1419|nr:hypothetical protein [Mycoplasmopsis anatis]MBW0594989.1 hypothetical protein [Mycoplasmopsis anatis]MBW0595163.1 hypothetical protein [Mycoplasmopsis anatis]MBW0598624.1 hypothetical protein [Mycoplasmopsis anatis]MBW0599367.1 hypothetical protein [Mycoplasmopsis anatis]MBW0601557.1 hypothetical protein [Mycoplasmopsis anatis]
MKKINKFILKTGAIVATPIIPIIAMSATTNNNDSQQNIQNFINNASLISARFMNLIELNIKFEGANTLDEKVRTFVLRFLSNNADIYQKISSSQFDDDSYSDALNKFKKELVQISEKGASKLFVQSYNRFNDLEKLADKYELNGFKRFYSQIQTSRHSLFTLEYTNANNETQFITYNGFAIDYYPDSLDYDKSLESIQYSVYSLSKLSPVIEHAFHLDFINNTIEKVNKNKALSLNFDSYLSENLFTINDKTMSNTSFDELRKTYAKDAEKLEKINKAQENLNKFVLKVLDDQTPEKAKEAQQFIISDSDLYKSKIEELDKALLNKIFSNTELASLYPNAKFSSTDLLTTYKTDSLAFTIANSELVSRMAIAKDDFNDKYEELKKYTDNLENYKDQLLNENNKLKDELANKNNELASKNNENSSLKNQLTSINNKNNTLTNENERLSAENTDLKAKEQNLANENNSLKEENNKLTTENSQKDNELKHSQSELAKVSTENRELTKSGTIKNVFWILFLFIAIVFGGLFAFVSFKNKKLKNQLKSK